MSEPHSGPPDDQHFLSLVADVVTQAWVALGKIKNPVSDRLDRNIPAAGALIDMLDMLNRKTAGNRSEQEDRLLLESIQQLKLNYIAEKDKPDEPVAQPAPADAADEKKASPAPKKKPAAAKPRKKKSPATKGKKAAAPKRRVKKDG
ncbi:MAG: DUF1844 domain-containing protein [Candidatus Neomarinimicrobiota bacterium]